MTIPTGLDTGFFVQLAAQHPEAVRLWAETIEGRRSGFASAITIFEIRNLALS